MPDQKPHRPIPATPWNAADNRRTGRSIHSSHNRREPGVFAAEFEPVWRRRFGVAGSAPRTMQMPLEEARALLRQERGRVVRPLGPPRPSSNSSHGWRGTSAVPPIASAFVHRGESTSGPLSDSYTDQNSPHAHPKIRLLYLRTARSDAAEFFIARSCRQPTKLQILGSALVYPGWVFLVR